MNIPVTAVTHDHLPSAIDSHLTHNSVDMMDSIPIDPTIHDTSVHQTPGLPVSSVTDHGHNPHPSPQVIWLWTQLLAIHTIPSRP